MGSHLVPLCSDLRQTNRAAGSSERVNARRAPVCPRPLQESMPNGVPAAMRPAPLPCGCRPRRSTRHGRPSFARPVAMNILCGHGLALMGRGIRLHRRLQEGLGMRHSRGDFR